MPARARRWLYAAAVHRTVIDSALERFVVAPVLTLARALDDAERRLASAFEPAKPTPLPAPQPQAVAALPSHAEDVD